MREKGLWVKNTLVENRYEVRDLARGGMGEVYFVYDRETERMMAVKTPLPSVLADESGLKRFYREAEAWISLGVHPNVCSAYYVQEIEGIPRLFIEYVDGGSLDRWLKAKRLTTVSDKLDMAIQIASGMHHTHTLQWVDEEGVEYTGLVHRDLKPANILLSKYGMALITDFGLVGAGLGDEFDGDLTNERHKESLNISEAGSAVSNRRDKKDDLLEGSILAKSMSSLSLAGSQLDGLIVSDSWQTITLGGVPFGTPQYMAPEQFKNAHLAGFPTDIYAFGCMLYEFFCNRRPFLLTEEERRAVIFYQITVWQRLHTKTPPPDPAEFTPDIDRELAELMLQCLAKKPDKRPKDFSEISERLKGIYKRITEEQYPRQEARTEELAPGSFNNQGVSYATINQLQRAETAWKRALTLDPQHKEAAFNLILYQCKRGLLSEDESFKNLQLFIDDLPSAKPCEIFKSKLSLFFSNEHRALQTLRDTTKSGQGSHDVYRDMGLLLCGSETAIEDAASWRDVKNSLRRLIQDNKEDPSVVTGYTLALKNLGEDYDSFYTSYKERFRELPDSLEDALHSFLPGFAITSGFSLEHAGITALALLSEGVVNDTEGTQMAIVGCNDSRLILVDLSTGKVVKPLKGHTLGITALAVSSNQRYALSASEDRSIALWDIEKGSCLKTFTGHGNTITDVLFVGRSAYAVSASMDGTIRAWDLKRGSEAGVFNTKSQGVHAIAITKDGKYLYSAIKGAPPCKWDTKTGRLLLQYNGHFSGSTTIDLSSDGRRLITGGVDNTVCLFDTNTGQVISMFKGHEGRITSVRFSHDDEFALTTSQTSLHVRDLTNGLLFAVFRYKGPIVKAFAGTRGHQILLAQSSEIICLNYLNRYNCNYALVPPAYLRKEDIKIEFTRRMVAARQQLDLKDYPGTLNHINSARELQGYKNNDKVVELLTRIPLIYNHSAISSAVKMNEYRPLDEDGIITLLLSYSGEQMFVGGISGKAARFDINNMTTSPIYDCPDDDGDYDSDDGDERRLKVAIKSLELSYCNEYVITGQDNGNIISWNSASNTPLREFNTKYKGQTSIALTRNVQHLFSAGKDGLIRLWHVETGKYMGRFDVVRSPIKRIILSRDEKTVIAGLGDGSVVFFDSVTGKILNSVAGQGDGVSALAMSADGTQFLTAWQDGGIGLWNFKTRTLLTRYMGHEDEATCVCFSPDGQFFASGGKDDTVCLWSIHNEECLQRLKGHEDTVSAVIFSPEGWNLYSAGMDGRVIKWFIDWVLDQEEGVLWKTQAKGLVSEFLSYQYRRGIIEKNKPSWSEEDIPLLESRIKAAGFEFALSDLLKDTLPSYKANWMESVPKRLPLEMDEPRDEGEIKQEKAAKRLTAKLIKQSAVVLLVLVVLALAAYMYSSSKNKYNEVELSRFDLKVAKAGMVHEALAYVKDKSQGDCDTKRLDTYKESYMYMINKHLTSIISTASMTQQNVSCLVKLSTSKEGIDTLIFQMLHTNNLDEAAAISYLLSYVGNNAINPLLTALPDISHNKQVNSEAGMDKKTRERLIVEAVVNMGSTEAVNVVIEYALRDDGFAESAAPYIKRIIATKRLDVDAALKALEGLMNNNSSVVRKNAVSTLVFFKGSEAKRLATKALQDSSEEVRKEAGAVLE